MTTDDSTESVHIWNRCHGCGMQPIVGLRFECQTCPLGPDSDLCEQCYREYIHSGARHPSPESPFAHLRQAGPHRFRSFLGAPRERHLPWLAVPFLLSAAPNVPDRFVVRPEFVSGRDSYFGSYAFVAESASGPPLVLTALHVMDEMIKAKGIDCSVDSTSYTGAELPPLVTKVALYDVFAPQWPLAELGHAGDMLVLPDARLGEEEPYCQRDVAAFRVQVDANVSPVRLAAAPPRVGEPLWLAINLANGVSGRTVPAVVVDQTEHSLIFRYTRGAEPRRSSGAPLLNRDGELVGINVGGGRFDGGHFGHAVHVASMRRHLHVNVKPADVD